VAHVIELAGEPDAEFVPKSSPEAWPAEDLYVGEVR
jgi:hypothetical protein